MPIPWLIGAAVIAVGTAVVKVVNDEIEEDERKDRQLSEAKRQAEREKEEQQLQLEAADQKRFEQERLASHKKKVDRQTSRLIEEHGLLNVDARQLAEEAISFPVAAKKTLCAAFDRSKPVQENAMQVRAIQKKFKKTEDFLIMLRAIYMNNTTLNFFNALDQFQADVDHLAQQQDDLMECKEHLKTSISNSSQFDPKGLNKHSPLVRSINILRTSIEQTFISWDKSVDNALPMKQLTDHYQDRIIFLIFGKVNAGKSSFANFIVSQAGDHQVKRFQFHQGKVEYLKQGEQFKEGFTETTATIQGVEIGKHLVLLDTPGLHSVTAVNGDLTRRFIDSADAVLWLTPSTSPGHVQELNDLKAELEKKKPLLPIITRSDCIDEDWCEDTQDIVNTVKNKTPENRKLQQNDVNARLLDFKISGSVGLESAKQPLSISLHAFKHDIDAGVSRDLAFEQAGLSHLFVHLTALISEAASYKSVKAKQQMENFLKGHILLSLNQKIQPLVKQAQNSCESVLKKLDSEEKTIAENVLIATEVEVSDLIEKHKKNRDQKKLLQEVNDLVNQQINTELQKSLSDFSDKIEAVSSQLDEQKIDGFKDKTMSFEKVKGLIAQSLTGSGGAAAGAAGGALLGSMVPVVGTIAGGVVGGVLGGLAGAAAGSYFVETETVTEVIGVGSEDLKQSLKKQLKESVPTTVSAAFAEVKAQIKSVQSVCNELNAEIQKFSKNVAGEGNE